MKHRAARRRTFPQVRETINVMTSKAVPHHKINRSYRPSSLQEQNMEKQQKRFDTVNQMLEKVSSKPVNTNLNQNNSNISTQNGIDEDVDESEVSIVGYLKAKPIKFQTLDELLKNFPSVRAALYKKRTATSAATSTETITSHLSSLQITSQSTLSPIQSTKSAWRTRRTYALIGNELSLVQSILVGDENESFGSIGDQPITRKDIRTLRGLTWLNDEVVNFYLALVARESGTPGNLRVYAFSTFFCSKLTKDGPTHTSWDRWMRRANITLFDYDLILIPIHQGNHWALTTIDFRSRCIGYYDSLGSTDDMCLGRIYAFVEHMYATKRQISPMPDGWRVQAMHMIPEQANGSDCGVFACQFGKYLAREWPLDFTQAQMPQFRLQMIYEIYTKQLIV
ncbi:unnamed protein product [Rotaria socialis]|uniref:Ubiquitin-like protease family profile domain-containing protein n=1 Tax=Rotaria socialis TaxID=392032 RepID=A0A817UAR6_9BILA|nr:unnamed protein product [Rotaria socialis]CAF3328777.1 unnamed protein product [Rotaria socialis]CAF3349255.1 unnamed protein product [Rotaria socialis]CAF3363604.1 unnamed protein product [Rotaria socialis]CAF3618583.1 unnamed protein product [Rotaria socialis]